MYMYIYVYICVGVCIWRQATLETIIVLGALQSCEKRLLASLFLSVVRLHGTTGLPQDGFYLNFIVNFSKICREKSRLIKIWEEQLYFTLRPVYINDDITHFLEWGMFQAKVVEKIKTHIVRSITFFENIAVCMIMWKIL